jgi:hypothetical protein
MILPPSVVFSCAPRQPVQAAAAERWSSQPVVSTAVPDRWNDLAASYRAAVPCIARWLQLMGY